MPARRTDEFTGPAGEFYAAAQLTRRRWRVGLSMVGAPGTDLIAEHENRDLVILVQVKAGSGRTTGLIVGSGAEPPVERPQRDGLREWFILVGLSEDVNAMPAFYIVPRNVISAFVYVGHRHRTVRAERPDSNGPRTLNLRDFKGYHEEWDLLRGDPDDVSYRFTGGFWEWLDIVGKLPEGHPGLKHVHERREDSA